MFASKQAGFCTNRANHVTLAFLSVTTKLLLSSSCRGVAQQLNNHGNRGALEELVGEVQGVTGSTSGRSEELLSTHSSWHRGQRF